MRSVFRAFEVEVGRQMGEGSFGIVYEGFIYKGICEYLSSSKLFQPEWLILALEVSVLSDGMIVLLFGTLITA